MKKLIITICIIVLCIGCILNNTNALAQKRSYYHSDSNSCQGISIRTFYDSRKRPHKIVIISQVHGVNCVDLDMNTYINGR